MAGSGRTSLTIPRIAARTLRLRAPKSGTRPQERSPHSYRPLAPEAHWREEGSTSRNAAKKLILCALIRTEPQCGPGLIWDIQIQKTANHTPRGSDRPG